MASVIPGIHRRQPLPTRLQPVLVWAAVALCAAIALAVARQAASGGFALPTDRSIWLALHLGAVVPALPLGTVVLFGRKGTARHKRLGRIWAVLMLVGALSSFGLHSLMGHLSPIHTLSALTIVAIPYGVRSAMRGDVARHQRTMTRVYIGLISAGLFAFVPGRLFGVWLFG